MLFSSCYQQNKFTIKALILAIIFSTSAIVYGQAWTTAADFTGDARDDAVGFSINDIGYFGTGRSTGSKDNNDWWKYENFNWTQVSSLPTIGRQYCSSFVIKGKGYLIGGINDYGDALKEVWEYTPSTDQWTQKQNFPSSARWSAIGFSIDDYGFFGTGANTDSCFSDFWKYNPTTDQWTQVASFPRKQFESVEFVIGGNGFVGLGLNKQSEYFNEFWRYHYSTDQWINIASLPAEGRKHSKAESTGQTAIIVGGHNGAQFLSDCWQYNSGSNTWTEITSIPSIPIRGMASFNLEDNLYFINGMDSNFTKQKTVWTYRLKDDNTPPSIILYPNPTYNNLNIDLSSLKSDNTQLTVFDILGRTVDSKLIENDFTQFDLTAQQKGTYLFLFETEETSVLKKVILTR